jgi:hypothetical protein
MNEHPTTGAAADTASDLDQTSALFAQLILQQTNMSMMLLGKIAHPESGQVYKDVEAAQLFIDQLEMLETKTRGNLTSDESRLLKQSLMNLRLAYVEAVESSAAPATQESSNPSSADAPPAATPPPPAAADEESRKKFSKKY